LSEISGLASQSQDDKMYIALSRILSTALEANRNLLELHDLKQKIAPAKEVTTINNTLILTTAELQ
jgi:hypothetical protein